ncbi:heparinase II/III family protein [Reichenbachiella agarivorans]|uniref:Heparinase II/III family protein n=1 Tax=Reichenbachiella agarivorans TaxID=2979464 RepID=A0ABY6CRF4_9BACT|nr:heparinase II/III family protein [Reichenbachiella agarivorans]UXP33101.1 heparinase II/III family protein [Reichenbachiella agarivorans]
MSDRIVKIDLVVHRIVLIGCLNLLLLCVMASCSQEQKTTVGLNHQSILFDKQSLALIQKEYKNIPLFNESIQEAMRQVEQEIANGIEVPVPQDLAGGYTHERHKLNYLTMQKAGNLFMITGNEKYAVYIHDMLLQYAKLFPTLSLHPSEKSYTRGKLFWQSLNDANWMVYTSQAYDCIYDWLNEEQKENLEKNLFRPYADFLSVENPQFFNRIHNHSTWACAGVGMMGLVMKDEELIQRALYGLEIDTLAVGVKDNDGGSILAPGQNRAGFLAQMDMLFSPDGFYAEGPYYQRYAIYPFVVFAASLENARPDLKIFEHRENILAKAVYALVNLADSDGEFYPINDAQKGMSYYSRELVSAVDIVYHFAGQNPELLSIAEKQEKVLLDATGFSVAQAITQGKAKPFIPKSLELRDGADGSEGGVGILRMNHSGGDINAVLKYTAQGMGHGHYDKLSYSLYENGDEVLQDYGVARFVNIEQKDGGGYLKENKTFSKQTIAHNTLVVDQNTNYGGKIDKANLHHSDRFFFDKNRSDIQIASAKDVNAYEGVAMQRTICLVADSLFEKPLVIDLFDVRAVESHSYDLPYYYFGQILSSNSNYKTNATLQPMGEKNGYQHIWEEGRSDQLPSNTKMTWMQDYKFYSWTAVTGDGDEFLLGRIGANDPHHNLRSDPMFMLRRQAKNAVFASVLESHGQYSPVSEFSTNAFSMVDNISITFQSEEFIALSIRHTGGSELRLVVCRLDNGTDTTHEIEIDAEKLVWTGPYYYQVK